MNLFNYHNHGASRLRQMTENNNYLSCLFSLSFFVFGLFNFLYVFSFSLCLYQLLSFFVSPLWGFIFYFTFIISTALWARIAQSVCRVATGWTVQGSNPVEGESFYIHPDWPWGPPSILYNGYGVLPRRKAARAWQWPPNPQIAPSLKKE